MQITALTNDRYACGSREGGDVIPLKALYQVCNMVRWGCVGFEYAAEAA